MSQVNSNKRPMEFDAAADAAFLGHINLPPEHLEDIKQAMQSSGLGFAEAALHLGLLTQEEIERAIEATLNDVAQRQSSIVEAALNKVSASRALVVREGSPVAPGRQLERILSVDSSHGEKLRALRTQLLLIAEPTRQATSIAVVSPRRGDGRSQLAAELAISFAQLGRRTLLVDADLRRPKLHALFDCEGEEGLSEAILEDSPPQTHPVRALPNMHLLTAGRSSQTNPLELLSDNRFAKIVDRWRNNYSFVIIDTPPAAEFADALAVATLAGRALLVSRTKHTTYNDVREMMRKLAITQSRVLGAVLNQF